MKSLTFDLLFREWRNKNKFSEYFLSPKQLTKTLAASDLIILTPFLNEENI